MLWYRVVSTWNRRDSFVWKKNLTEKNTERTRPAASTQVKRVVMRLLFISGQDCIGFSAIVHRDFQRARAWDISLSTEQNKAARQGIVEMVGAEGLEPPTYSV